MKILLMISILLFCMNTIGVASGLGGISLSPVSHDGDNSVYFHVGEVEVRKDKEYAGGIKYDGGSEEKGYNGKQEHVEENDHEGKKEYSKGIKYEQRNEYAAGKRYNKEQEHVKEKDYYRKEFAKEEYCRQKEYAIENIASKMKNILRMIDDYKLKYLNDRTGKKECEFPRNEIRSVIPILSDVRCMNNNNRCQYDELCVEVNGNIGCACPPDMVNAPKNPRNCVKADLCSIGLLVENTDVGVAADTTRISLCPQNSRCKNYGNVPQCRCMEGTAPVYATSYVSSEHHDIIFPFAFLDSNVRCFEGCAVKESTKYLSGTLRRQVDGFIDVIKSSRLICCEESM